MNLSKFIDDIKAQYTLVGLMMTFVSIIVFSQIYPVIKPFIASIVSTADPSTALIVELIPFVIGISIIFGIIWYIIPRR